MTLLIGVVLLYLSLFLIMALRILLNRPVAPRWTRNTLASDFGALLITATLALGVTLISAAVIEAWSAATGLELAAGLAALVVAGAATWRLLRKLWPGSLVLDGQLDASGSIVAFPGPSQDDGAPPRSGPSKGAGVKRAA